VEAKLSHELRTGKRFPLALPFAFKDGKSAKSVSGSTIDVSGAGVYVQSAVKMAVGERIEFSITLPAAVLGTKTDVGIHCKGRVVRVDEPKNAKSKNKIGKQGVACVIDHYKFVRKK